MISFQKKREPVYIETIDTDIKPQRDEISIRQLGIIIRRLACKNRLSGNKLASKANIAPCTLSSVISGKRPEIHLSKVDRIARVLGLRLSELIAMVENEQQ